MGVCMAVVTIENARHILQAGYDLSLQSEEGKTRAPTLHSYLERARVREEGLNCCERFVFTFVPVFAPTPLVEGDLPAIQQILSTVFPHLGKPLLQRLVDNYKMKMPYQSAFLLAHAIVSLKPSERSQLTTLVQQMAGKELELEKLPVDELRYGHDLIIQVGPIVLPQTAQLYRKCSSVFTKEGALRFAHRITMHSEEFQTKLRELSNRISGAETDGEWPFGAHIILAYYLLRLYPKLDVEEIYNTARQMAEKLSRDDAEDGALFSPLCIKNILLPLLKRGIFSLRAAELVGHFGKFGKIRLQELNTIEKIVKLSVEEKIYFDELCNVLVHGKEGPLAAFEDLHPTLPFVQYALLALDLLKVVPNKTPIHRVINLARPSIWGLMGWTTRLSGSIECFDMALIQHLQNAETTVPREPAGLYLGPSEKITVEAIDIAHILYDHVLIPIATTNRLISELKEREGGRQFLDTFGHDETDDYLLTYSLLSYFYKHGWMERLKKGYSEELLEQCLAAGTKRE